MQIKIQAESLPQGWYSIIETNGINTTAISLGMPTKQHILKLITSLDVNTNTDFLSSLLENPHLQVSLQIKKV